MRIGVSHSPNRLWLPHQLIIASWTPVGRERRTGCIQMMPGFHITFPMKSEADEPDAARPIAHHMLT